MDARHSAALMAKEATKRCDLEIDYAERLFKIEQLRARYNRIKSGLLFYENDGRLKSIDAQISKLLEDE